MCKMSKEIVALSNLADEYGNVGQRIPETNGRIFPGLLVTQAPVTVRVAKQGNEKNIQTHLLYDLQAKIDG